MDEDTSTTCETYKTSEAARELGISAGWLRTGEERGFFPPACRDPYSGHRNCTSSDIKHLLSRRTGRHIRG